MRPPIFDGTLGRCTGATAVVGVLLAVGAGGLGGGQAAASTLLAAALAVSNVGAMAWIGRGVMERCGGIWTLLGTLKMGALFALVAWLLHHEIVRVLPFALGYASLPAGAVLAVLTGPAPPDDPSDSP